MGPNRVLAGVILGATWVGRIANGIVLSIATFYFVVSISVAYFKLTGQIIEGERMYLDLRTPSWGSLLTFQAACVAVIAAGLVVRRLLRGQRDSAGK